MSANSWFEGDPLDGLPYMEEAVRLAPMGLLAAVAGRHAEGLETLPSVDESCLAGHHTFHLAESYSMAGAHDRAVFLLDRAVTLGFYPHEYYARRCPFYEALRGHDDFAGVVCPAAERTNSFHAAMTSFVA